MSKKKIQVSAKEDINLLKDQISDLELKWKRAMADYQNLEKRVASQKDELIKYLNAGLLEKLLVVLDDLQRAAKHLNDQGLNLVLSKFEHIIKNEGVEEIKAEGDEFDPETMDCIDLVKGQNNKVIKIMEKGYFFHGRVLRPVKVKVGKGGPLNSKN